MLTALYSILHFLVDGICAWAMFGRFRGDYGAILVYNFCAFALQMPLGAVLDRVSRSKTAAGLGAALTCLGALTHPAVLGLGNALFHVGGGVEVIGEDHRKGLNGQALGIFVAPGALGLYLGTQLAGGSLWLLVPAAVAMALLLLPLGKRDGTCSAPAPTRKNGPLLAACCFAVVVLRSHVGMAVGFSWKTGIFGLLAVLAVVLGKMAGGILAARFGARNVTVVSLGLSAICYAFGDHPAFGLTALFCFNMTMPLTLYALWRRFPEYPGTVFGALTVALFLGFLPTYYGWDIPIGGVWGSVISLVLLWKAVSGGVSDQNVRRLAGPDAGD